LGWVGLGYTDGSLYDIINRDLEQMWRSLWAALVEVMREKRQAFVNTVMNIHVQYSS